MNTETIDNIFSSLQVMNETVKTNAEKCVANEFYRMKNEILNGMTRNMLCDFNVLQWQKGVANGQTLYYALVEFKLPSGKTYVFHRPLNKRQTFAQFFHMKGIEMPSVDSQEWYEYSRNECAYGVCESVPSDVQLLTKWYLLFKVQRYANTTCDFSNKEMNVNIFAEAMRQNTALMCTSMDYETITDSINEEFHIPLHKEVKKLKNEKLVNHLILYGSGTYVLFEK